MITAPTAPSHLAGEVFTAISTATQIAPLTGRVDGFDLNMAYAIASEVRALRDEAVVGHKIGFTNRTLWERYGVNAPMWGDMTASSVTPLDETPVALAPYSEPRLEPEVALKLKRSPNPGLDDEALLGCIEWFAPAFEIVQSIYPGWAFKLADCAAANGLHGRLLLGPTVPAGPWAHDMAAITLQLMKNGELIEVGHGHNVLGGPLLALRHFVEARLAHGAAPLSVGDIITTGTLTDAWSLSPGDRFEAIYSASPLPAISATFR
ncbi:MAG: fumarylacetoacetate hydrolase family protein [Pseudomonadota bacterium]